MTRRPRCFFPGSRALIFAALLGILLLTATVQAQVSTADILGAAFDPTGAVVVGVKVTVTNLSTGITRVASSNETGNFLITALPVGHYSVKAESTASRPTALLTWPSRRRDRARIDLQMEVGQVSDSVNVAAQTPALQADSSSLGTLINAKPCRTSRSTGGTSFAWRSCPQEPTRTATTHCRAATARTTGGSSTAVAVNGQHGYNNNFMIDGLDDNERYIGTIVLKPPWTRWRSSSSSPMHTRPNWAARPAALLTW